MRLIKMERYTSACALAFVVTIRHEEGLKRLSYTFDTQISPLLINIEKFDWLSIGYGLPNSIVTHTSLIE